MESRNLVGYKDSDSDSDVNMLDKDLFPANKVSEVAIKDDYSSNIYQASLSNHSWESIKTQFVEMGYSTLMVEKAVSIHGVENWNGMLEYLLTCKAVDYSLDSSHENSATDSTILKCEDKNNLEENKVKCEDDFVETHGLKETQLKGFQADTIIATLLEMGYSEHEVSSAIEINGITTPIDELVDFIDAYLYGKEADKDNGHAVDENHEDKKQKKQDKEACTINYYKRKQADVISSGLKIDSSSIHKRTLKEKQKNELKNGKRKESMQCREIMVDAYDEVLNQSNKAPIGFGVPEKPVRCRHFELRTSMQGPPFFYFENDAFVPNDIWKTIFRHFNGVEPEFVDSRYFSASKQLRGYVHNLPLDGRFQALPLPPMTIQEAFPQSKEYWPSWDQRSKLNCIGSRRGSDSLCQELRSIMQSSQGNPSLSEQSYILEKCEQWNLVWVGPNQMAPLEPHEIEVILGYEKDHTRGASCLTDRLECLSNSFQTDTVAYHLSVLKPFYPDGLKVLSLFSGIGGAEVALHRLGIHLMYVVSVEICPRNRLILQSWWKKTQQTGILVEKEDVQHLNREVLEVLIDMVKGFDLIIGSGPYNNPSAENRTGKDRLEGRNSSLFYEFPRIVNEVRQIMHSKGMC